MRGFSFSELTPFLSESADQQDLGGRRQLYFSLIHKPEREMKNISRNLSVLFITVFPLHRTVSGKCEVSNKYLLN